MKNNKTTVCICGHNLYSHQESETHTWISLSKYPDITLTFQQCAIPTCNCIKFRENVKAH